MELKKLHIMPLLAFLLSMTLVTSVDMGVNVLNVAPEVGDVDSPEHVTLSSGEKTRIWCNATVTDLNGYSDIKKITAAMWNSEISNETDRANETKHYKADLVLVQSTESIITKSISAAFNIKPSAEPGVWTCQIKAVDMVLGEGSGTADIFVHSTSCSNGVLDDGELLVDCGGNDCKACIDIDGISMEIPAGKSGSVPLRIYSSSGEAIGLTAVQKTTLRENDGVIPSENIDVILPTIIESKDEGRGRLQIDVPRDTKNHTYVGKITVYTNSSVSAEVDISIKVLPPLKGRIGIYANKSCVDRPTVITFRDTESNDPIGDADIGITYKIQVLHNLRSDSDGVISFTPGEEGTYVLEAEKANYSKERIVISILECEPDASCFDGMQNNDEEDIDCGGSCYPCHCFDGMQNNGEEGIDCGNSCSKCPTLPVVPQLVIHSLKKIELNQNLSLQVKDTSGNFAQVILKITKPDGAEQRLRTDPWGRAEITMDFPGEWTLEALKAGYKPTYATVMVTEKRVVSILTKSISYLSYPNILIIILLVLLLLFYLRTKKIL